MRSYPVGVMIARGDLAIETGWKNFASIQEEIMRVCEAAHIPDVSAKGVIKTYFLLCLMAYLNYCFEVILNVIFRPWVEQTYFSKKKFVSSYQLK